MHVPLCKPCLGDPEIEAVVAVLRSGRLTNGPKVEEFEEVVAKYSQAKYAVATSSGTTALHLGLLASGISKGCKVDVPSFTFPATINAVIHTGATPVFQDVKRTTHSRFVMAVPLFGAPSPVSDYMTDAACGLGAVPHNGRHVTVYSFHPRKIITTGEGGMLVTDNPTIAGTARRLRNHALSDGGYRQGGFNYRMTDIQAALGIKQMKRLDDIIARRRAIAVHYWDRLQSWRVQEAGLHQPSASPEHTYQSYVCTYEGDRDQLIKDLKIRDIETQVGSYACHRIWGLPDKDFPNSAWLADHTIALPIYPQMTPEEQDYVIRNIEEVLK